MGPSPGSRIGFFIALLALTMGPVLAAEAREKDPPAPKLKEVATDYFARLDAIYRAGSSVAELDAFFSLMQEDVKYEHLRFGADFDLESWRAAFLRNYERGAYQHQPGSGTRILNVIGGLDAVVVEHEYHNVPEEGEEARVGGPFVTLFEFKEGKIARVREYW